MSSLAESEPPEGTFPLDQATLLLIESDASEARSVVQALRQIGIKNPVQILEDGNIAVRYLAGDGVFSDRETYPLPAAILLDAQLPRGAGSQLRQWLSTQEELKDVALIVLDSASPADTETNGLRVTKPAQPAQLEDLFAAQDWNWLEREATVPHSEPVQTNVPVPFLVRWLERIGKRRIGGAC